MQATQPNPSHGLFLVKPYSGRPPSLLSAERMRMIEAQSTWHRRGSPIYSQPRWPQVNPIQRSTRPGTLSTDQIRAARMSGARQEKGGGLQKKKPIGGEKNRNGGNARDSRTIKPVSAPRPGTKAAKVLGLLRRLRGATVKELMKATGWQAHSVRAFLSAVASRKMSLKLSSNRRASGEHFYRIT